MRVEINSKTLRFPRTCPCCGGHPDIERTFFATRVTAGEIIRTKMRSWSVPYCSSCAGHASAWPGPIRSTGLALGLVTCGAWLLADHLMRESARRAARARCSPSCVAPGFAVDFVGWDGRRQVFDFVSDAYAVEFALANERALVDASPALLAGLELAKEERRRALVAEQEEQHRRALRAGQGRLQALESRRDDPILIEGEFQRCLARVEGCRTAAARRSALRSGLRALERRPEQGLRLLAEAARIEVEAALAKVGRGRTARTQRRCLTAALEELRSDGTADELRVKQIGWLEAALAELDDVGSNYDARSA
ncbi:MAG TPA: hypothetical protein VFS00_05335 [Polyangiaceae bacterium]|nr:hypothetical protein [Polyangiaceae bacterium]